MTSKSEYVYNLIFEDVIKILYDNKIKLKNIPKNIMIDCEKPLQNSIKKNFREA